jgi:hypothetical protein
MKCTVQTQELKTSCESKLISSYDRAYRFSEYSKDGNNAMARMLYNHATDPDETVNVSERPDNVDTVAALTRELRARKGKPASNQ